MKSSGVVAMPFRLLNPTAQCRATNVIGRRRTVDAALRSVSDGATQCEGITRAGRRCAVTAKSNFHDATGRLVSGPLRQGSRLCLLHLELFCTEHVADPSEVIVFFLDLETSGLDVLHDEVLEIAVTAESSDAKFATTVLPTRLPDGLGVHGIERDELLSGVPFACAFNRMVAFLQDVTMTSFLTASAMEEDIVDEVAAIGLSLELLEHRHHAPVALIAAHNGLKFDFPMLVSECLRHDCNLFQLQQFYFCDTLPLARAFSGLIGDACARLQCLARCCACGAGRQHRALEDTVVLRYVVQYCAHYSGVPVWTLLSRFAQRFDAHATLAAHRTVS